MSVYAVLGIIVTIGVILLLLALRRPRSAEDVLGQSIGRATAGSPGRSAGQSVRSVIQSLVNDRATGLLTVVDGNETCSICFLFGHMFHAWCGTLQGEEAVYWALSRVDAVCRFDRKAMLPTEETITRSTASLLEAS